MNSLASKKFILKDSSAPTIFFFWVREEFEKTTKREAICFVSPPLCTNKVVHQSHCRNGFALNCKVVLIVREEAHHVMDLRIQTNS